MNNMTKFDCERLTNEINFAISSAKKHGEKEAFLYFDAAWYKGYEKQYVTDYCQKNKGSIILVGVGNHLNIFLNKRNAFTQNT
ncbi:MAG: hypothetical protein LBL91_05150 [Lachnospiraceae bacterium]|nr:hypothetical protein [Lachnospiraceae bacterium]